MFFNLLMDKVEKLYLMLLFTLNQTLNSDAVKEE